MSLKILIMSWNAHGLRLCETSSQEVAVLARRKAGISRPKCLAPNFFANISGSITSDGADIVVITTQEESGSGTYFHAEFLPANMSNLGYGLLKRQKMDRIGHAHKFAETGPPSGAALRVSIYVKAGEVDKYAAEESVLKKVFVGGTIAEISCGRSRSGAIASYVDHGTFGRMVFVAAHLPVAIEDMRLQEMDYPEYRSLMDNSNNACLISILSKSVTSLTAEKKVAHVFLFGDLGYDIVHPEKKEEAIVNEIVKDLSKVTEWHTYDGIRSRMANAPFKGFSEGIEGKGPMFPPTWNMKVGRSPGCSAYDETGKLKSSISSKCYVTDKGIGVGWHDRILTKDIDAGAKITKCIKYGSIDVGIQGSSHSAGVYGVYSIGTMA